MILARHASLAELEPLAPDWNALAAGNPFLSWEWLSTWWRHYSEHGALSVTREPPTGGAELYIVSVRDEQGVLLGLAPWYLDTCRPRAQALRFLGSGEVCSDYPEVLARPGQEGPVATALADFLWRAANERTEWDWIEWEGLEAATEVSAAPGVTRRLVDLLEEKGGLVYEQACMSCWRITLPDSWESFVRRLSKSHRKQVRRRTRDFDSRAKLVVARTDDELAQGLSILQALHQSRRESLREVGLFSSRPFASFLADVTPKLQASGRLRLTWLEFDGRPIAAEYQLLGAGVVYAYQSGVDPGSLSLEPGRLATIAAIRDAISERATTYDMLRGDEPYKAHWRCAPSPRVTTRVLPGGAGDYLRRGSWIAKDGLKYLLRSTKRLAAAVGSVGGATTRNANSPTNLVRASS